MAISQSANELVRQIKEDSKEFQILGYISWWSIKDVSLNKEQLVTALKAAGISEKYARDHNYRSTLSRAIKELEDESLVRKVSEDSTYIVFQFTDETPKQDIATGYAHLQYTPKVVVKVDKEAFGMFQDIDQSIESITDPTTGQISPSADEFKTKIVEAFNRHRSHYKSSDLTRYVQLIFKQNADIISLREQGSVYFIPAEFENIVKAVAKLFEHLNLPGFQYMPVPDVSSARKMVGDSFAMEAASLLHELEQEVKEMNDSGKEMADTWLKARLNRLDTISERIKRYNSVLGDRLISINGKVDVVQQILKPRALMLD